MIQGILISNIEDLPEIFEVRKKVFVEELGISEEIVIDELDQSAIHAVVYEGQELKKVVAIGRILFDGETFIIDKVAVKKEYRGLMYGDFIVRLLLNKAFTAGAEKVFLYSQPDTIGFYTKLGFQNSYNDTTIYGKIYNNMTISKNNVVKKCGNHIN